MSELLPEPPEVRLTQWLESLRTDLAESVAGIALRGARVIPINHFPSGPATERLILSSSPGALLGFSLKQAGDPLDFSFFDGSHDDAPLVALGSDAASGPVTQWFGPSGLNLTYGLSFEQAGGSGVVGVAYFRGVD